ncbi:MAG: hypothetical protein WCA21_00170 [Terracidiphilus sp.]
MMNWKYRFNSLTVLVLALAFYWFFMFSKHDPSLAPIIPFGDDPYDAAGSFCLVASLLLAALSLFRAFRPYNAKPPAILSSVFLARTQIAVPIGIVATLVADTIALARHPNMWTGKPAEDELLALMIGLAVFSLAVLYFVRQSIREFEVRFYRKASMKAVTTAIICGAVLALFPEAAIQSVFVHFLAIVLSFVLIAALQATFAVALLPYETAENESAETARTSWARPGLQWLLVSLFGSVIGASLLMAEIVGDGAGKAPLRQVVVVSAMFIGAGTALLLVAFAFYKKPLGIFRNISQA